MTRDQLLALIRKCLALARSDNEHEAAAALAKARQLMDDHAVDHAEMAAIDVGEVRAKGGGAWTPTAWEAELVDAVMRAMPVEAMSCQTEGWAFIGFAPAPEIASYAFTALYRQLKRARADYMTTALRRVRTPRRKTARADAFALGWAQAVYVAMTRLYPHRDTDEVVMAWLERRYRHSPLAPREGKAGTAGATDRARGYSAGRDVSLAQGVTGTAPVARIGHGA